MRREEELVRLVARAPGPDETETGLIENLLKENLDWNYVLKRSEEEGISLLLYCHLKSHDLPDKYHVPQDILERTKTAYYNNSLRNMLLAEEAKKILNILNAENIPAMTLKGIFLAENVYKNIAVRPITDLDLLIKKEDLAQTNGILCSLGYLAPPNYTDFFLKKEGTPINSLVYHKPGAYFFLHLHWHIVNSTWPLDSLVEAIDMERIWSLAEGAQINTAGCLSLAPHHLLIYLAHHGFIHHFHRSILFSDLLGSLRCYKDRLDWDQVVKEAQRFNLSLVLYYSLSLTSKQLMVTIPELEKLKPTRFGFLEKLLFSFMSKGRRWPALYYLTYFLGEKGALPKIRFIKKTLFPSSYVMAHSLSRRPVEINARHYYQRIIRNFPDYLP